MAATAGLKLVEIAPDSGLGMLTAVESQSGNGHRPRAPRQRTLIRAVMRAPGLPGHDVIVRDVSERGMRIASRGITVHVSEIFSITLPDGVEVDAQVRWAKGEEFGAELFDTLDLRRIGLTNQRRHARSAGEVIHWLIDERLRAPAPQQTAPRLRFC
ncbi:PilZ domain-containing protein [Novosphingobium album (ex Hu et al. 2023)]|uniref:PilZ domain-containing protein n=1 Tax=Novosphingobium album (ex Hu et al. 2023) TaxID=2930093 RepID=A0ABT0B3S6_9SPHN|nr:PilZ domain-containing protein [Novosphingobium album (ex Hu et al. 2023)]MCJ2179705.1 PilZ domain-containing protein [Novosphingobium album (ex Hu et al. 2023)]